jgi:predicted alpha-1,2-mannosidase
VGQYAHGNEPSHHTIYLFQYAGRPDRTAELVREVCDRFYRPEPDGLCGNDDCGQMSAWYLFSAMGFYPLNPCGGEYVLGAPQVPKVVLRVPPRTFTVVAKNLSKENKYVKSVTLNGKPLVGRGVLDAPILRHADIMRGGELVFEMTGSR